MGPSTRKSARARVGWSWNSVAKLLLLGCIFVFITRPPPPPPPPLPQAAGSWRADVAAGSGNEYDAAVVATTAALAQQASARSQPALLASALSGSPPPPPASPPPASPPPASPPPASPPRSAWPNLVLLLADDLRADVVSDPAITPHLYALASRGVTMGRAYTMGSTEPAVCAPSRAMLMTGRNLWHSHCYGVPYSREAERAAECRGQKQNALPPSTDTPTLAERLHGAGYSNYYVGKWHNTQPSFRHAYRGGSGSALAFGGMWEHRKVPAKEWLNGVMRDLKPGAVFSTDLFAVSRGANKRRRRPSHARTRGPPSTTGQIESPPPNTPPP